MRHILFRWAGAIALGTGIAVSVATGIAPGRASADSAVGGYVLLVMNGKPVKWAVSEDGAPTVVRYRFIDEPVTRKGALNCREMKPFPASFAEGNVSFDVVSKGFRTAFDYWQQAAGLRFVEVEAGADILLGLQARARGVAYADVIADAGGNAAFAKIREAAICLNPELTWNLGFDGDLSTHDIGYVALHETGHAIGLDHVHSGKPLVMSFRYTETYTGLQAGDIAGAQRLYGPSEPAATDFVKVPPAEALSPVSAEVSR